MDDVVRSSRRGTAGGGYGGQKDADGGGRQAAGQEAPAAQGAEGPKLTGGRGQLGSAPEAGRRSWPARKRAPKLAGGPDEALSPLLVLSRTGGDGSVFGVLGLGSVRFAARIGARLIGKGVLAGLSLFAGPGLGLCPPSSSRQPRP